jgi:hypothetical protein
MTSPTALVNSVLVAYAHALPGRLRAARSTRVEALTGYNAGGWGRRSDGSEVAVVVALVDVASHVAGGGVAFLRCRVATSDTRAPANQASGSIRARAQRHVR